MGLLQSAYKTYCAAEQEIGKYEEGKQPLAPVSHVVMKAHIEITLDQEGMFIAAKEVDKDDEKIIIPATQKSAGRTSGHVAHPLCEQIGYLCGLDEEKYQLYVTQLEQWNASPWSHPKLQPVLNYVKSKQLLSDLVRCGLVTLNTAGMPKDDKLLICWRILNADSDAPPECWRDKTLFQSFIDYYASIQNMPQGLCMVSGMVTGITDQHPQKIVSFYDRAKIISSGDENGFTYRGRFENDWQTATVSYEVSQKAHAALSWLVANQGTSIGRRVFLCWNPNGVKLPHVNMPLRPKKSSAVFQPSEYRQDLQRTLLGEKERLPQDTQAVIVAFDAATTGRLSVTYYNELLASDFVQRLHDWDESCCWYYGKLGVQSPWLENIVDCAYGVQRVQKRKPQFVTDDRVRRQQMQRMVACRINRARMPADILRRLVERTSNPMAYDEGLWQELLFVTCAVIQKYHAPMLKEELCMEWKLDRKDPSFQYGRLLAVMERAEADYYGKTNESRQTNALKSLTAFKKTPWKVFERVNEKLESAYLNRLDKRSRNRYYRLRDEIVAILCQCCEDLNAPLNEFYLVGYSLQRNAFFESKDSNNQETTENKEE